MPFINIKLHFVWSTKNRIPFLETKELRKIMWQHIKDNAKKKNIHIVDVSGYHDHCHCIVSLGSEQTISNIMQLIKGESAFWFNKQKLITNKFQWQDEYFVASVSEANMPIVLKYLNKQEVHHKTKTFNDEFEAFLLHHNFTKLKDDFN
jgi:putative transposase